MIYNLAGPRAGASSGGADIEIAAGGGTDEPNPSAGFRRGGRYATGGAGPATVGVTFVRSNGAAGGGWGSCSGRTAIPPVAGEVIVTDSPPCWRRTGSGGQRPGGGCGHDGHQRSSTAQPTRRREAPPFSRNMTPAHAVHDQSRPGCRPRSRATVPVGGRDPPRPRNRSSSEASLGPPSWVVGMDEIVAGGRWRGGGPTLSPPIARRRETDPLVRAWVGRPGCRSWPHR
jgi:hypothetical protein